MDNKTTGQLLAQLRNERNLTQRQIAETLHISPQAVSKWERGLGCPDVGLLSGLSEIFGVSMERLLAGDLAPSAREAGNMKRMKFYMCPGCSNVITASGNGEFHCCGRKLAPLSVQAMDEAHTAVIQEVEDEWYITFPHPMRKEHFIRFAAYVAMDRCLLLRLYPEQGGEFRIPHLRRGGKLYLCCSQDGLFEIPTKNKNETVK